MKWGREEVFWDAIKIAPRKPPPGLVQVSSTAKESKHVSNPCKWVPDLAFLLFFAKKNAKNDDELHRTES